MNSEHDTGVKHAINRLYHTAKARKTVLMVLSCFVVFVTTYMLILPAVTLEQDEAERQGGIDLPVVQQTEAHQDAAQADKLKFEGKGYEISASCGEAALPEGTQIEAEEIGRSDDSYDALYEDALQAVREESGDKSRQIAFAKFYDISLISDGEPIEPDGPVDVTISYDKALKVSDADNLRIVHFAVDEESGEVSAEVLGPEKVGAEIRKNKMTETTFTAASFSVYAVVYTVDFHYEVNGKMYDFSIPGGGFISLKDLVEVLGISEEPETFVADVEGVEFSSPELMDVSKVEADTTVGQIKEDRGLEEEYSAELTEEQIAEINAQTVEAGDWAIISLQSFTSEESLTVTMKNGDQFVVRLTDYMNALENSEFDGTSHFVIWAEGDNGRYYALKTDGTTAEISKNDIDSLGQDYQWTITYDPNSTDGRYFIRPVGNPSRCLTLNQANQTSNLVQNGSSGIRIYRPDNTYTNNWKLEGWNWSSLYLNNYVWGNRRFEGNSQNFSHIYLSKQEDPDQVDRSNMIALNPMNENGVLPIYADYSSTHYKDFTIDGHKIEDYSDLQYARIYIPVDYQGGTATITLPANADLDHFDVSGADTMSHSITQDTSKYQWELKGWYNIATKEYYSVADGPRTITVDQDDLNVFYADWAPARYDFTNTNHIETADTSSFVTIGVWDYNEMYNLTGSDAYKVDQDAHLFDPRDTIENEEWYIHQTNGVQGDFVEFVDNTDPDLCWQYGTLGNAQGRNEGNRWSNYVGWAPNFGIAGDLGASQLGEGSTHVIGDLFDYSNTPGSGVTYVGPSNYLFSYDPNTKRYSYDSMQNGAVYSQTDKRFYVSNDPSYYETNHGTGKRGFLPFNDATNGLTYRNGTINYWFGMKIDLSFWLPDVPGSPNANRVGNNNDEMEFTFRGDDDVWVFIDDKLVLDIGGIHEALNGSINFSTGDVRVQTSQNQTTLLCNIYDRFGIGAGSHKLTFYYVERGANESNCEIAFNLMPRWIMDPVEAGTVKVKKTWSANTPSDKREDLEFTLKTTDNETIDTVEYADGVYNGTSGEWTYVWEALDPDKDYVVEETQDPDFDTDTDMTVDDSGKYQYWAATAYDDTVAFGINTLLLGNGLGGENGKLLKSNGNSTGSTGALIQNEIVDGSSVDDSVKWTVSDYSQTDMHFYLKDSSGKYLSIRNGNIQLVNSQSDASWFYMGPTGDLNDARSNNRLLIDNSGNIAVGEKKGSEFAGIESADRVHLYAYQEITTKTYNYSVVNNYNKADLDILKVDATDMSTPLEKAQFKLTKLDPDGRGDYLTGSDAFEMTSEETDAYGKTSFEGIKTGYYEISEIKMPAGYIRVGNDKFYIRVKDGEVRHIIATENDPDTADIDESLVKNWTVVDDNNDGPLRFSAAGGGNNASFTVGNEPGAALPNSGGPGTSWIYLIGSMLLIGCGVALVTRRRMYR